MVRVEDLEGWLLKYKSAKRSSGSSIAKFLASSTGESTRRWFRVMSLRSDDSTDLAFCYFRWKNDRDSDPKGWIHLRDIERIWEDGDTFTLETPIRIIELKAPSKAEHRLWLQGLAERCHRADRRSLSRIVTLPIDDTLERREEQLTDYKIDTSEELLPIHPIKQLSSKQSVDSADKERNRISSSRPPLSPRSLDREDHRLGSVGGNMIGRPVTTRLHDHIRKDSDDPTTISGHRSDRKLAGAVFIRKNNNSISSREDIKTDCDSMVAVSMEDDVQAYAKYLDESESDRCSGDRSKVSTPDGSSDEEEKEESEDSDDDRNVNAMKETPSNENISYSPVERLDSDEDQEEHRMRLLVSAKTPFSSPIMMSRKSATHYNADDSDDEKPVRVLTDRRSISLRSPPGLPPRPENLQPRPPLLNSVSAPSRVIFGLEETRSTSPKKSFAMKKTIQLQRRENGIDSDED